MTKWEKNDWFILLTPFAILFAFIVLFFGYTLYSQNHQFVRKFGGEETLELEPGRKLMNATWKGDSLWILTREMKPEDMEETYTYSEYSNFGILEGKVIIKEKK